jgi:hypothetical protein
MNGTTVQPRLTTNPIRCIQLNTNRQWIVVHTLLNTLADNTDIILVQEPRWGFIGTNEDGEQVNGPVGHPAWTPVLPMAAMPPGARPRVMAYYQNRADFSVTLRSDIIQHLDVQVLDIVQQGSPTVTVVNIYNDPKLNRESPAHQLRNMPLPNDHPVLITGDWNLHHPLWSANLCANNELTNDVVEWLSDQGYTMMNKKGVPTFAQHGGRGRRSTIDLTFANAEATRNDTAKDWVVDPALGFGSDHYAIKWTIDNGREEIDNLMGTRYNLKEVEPGKWCEAFRRCLQEREATLMGLLAGEQIDNTELDEAATALTDAMQAATAEVAPVRRPSPRARPWWSKDLTEAADRVKQLREEAAQVEGQAGFRDRNLKSKIHKA